MNLLPVIFDEVRNLSEQGGWVFWSLIALAFGICFALVSLWHAMQFPGAPILKPKEWIRLLRGKSGDEDLLGRLKSEIGDDGAAQGNLEEIEKNLFSKPERRFPFAFVMIGVAPLIGLLGTVTGMCTTFNGMSSSSGNAPIDVISQGISEALITTQTGLVIGVPTFIACSLLKSRHDHLVLAFRKLEARLMQHRAA